MGPKIKVSKGAVCAASRGTLAARISSLPPHPRLTRGRNRQLDGGYCEGID